MVLSRALLASLLACLLLLLADRAASPSSAVRTPVRLPARPVLVAHRGGRGVRPENTLAAIRHSVAQYGVDVIETDVRRTRDGVFVLLHDEEVDRTTDGHGRVGELTLDELRALDFGYRFTDGAAHPWRGRGVGVATLREVYAELAGTGVVVSVELKEQGAEAVDALVGELATMPGFEAFMCFCSADHATNSALKARTNHSLCYAGSERDVATHVVVSALGVANVWYALHPNTNRLLFQPFRSLGGISLPALQDDALLARTGIEPLFFTVNTPQDGAACVLQGCRGITTDRPDVMQRVLALLAGRNATGAAAPEEGRVVAVVSQDAETTSWECESALCVLVDAVFGALPAPLLLFAAVFAALLPGVAVLEAAGRLVARGK